MKHFTNGFLLPALLWLSLGCKSYNLERAPFPVCAKPSAAINYAGDELEVVFSLTNPQGDIGAIGWDLGDGRHKTGARVKVAYAKPGTYTITLVLANACDDSFMTTLPVTVTN